MSGYSVLILTLNEERNLRDTLASVRACDDIVVLDSGSVDRTIEIAKGHGAHVHARPFDTFAGQRNFAQRNIEFRHPWVFHLDADERFTPELAAECEVAATAMDVDGYFVAPKMLWQGKWIPHCTDYPAFQARFVRAPGFEFIDVGHGQRESPKMRMRHLRCNYLHELASGGDTEWLEKHHRYALKEAEQVLRENGSISVSNLASANRIIRRRALKHFSYRLPFRPTLRFIYQYVLRGGFLDGDVGLHYCRLLARYEGFAAEELHRLKNRSR